MCRRDDGSELYDGSPLILPEHDAILKINVRLLINHSDYTQEQIYNACRLAWRLGQNRTEEDLLSKIKYVVACYRRTVLAVFQPTQWHKLTTNECSNKNDIGRWAFIGHFANEEIKNRYIGRRVPGTQGHCYFHPMHE